MEIQRLTVVREGWVHVTESEPEVRVQFKETDGRLEPIGLALIDAVVSNRVLARIPFGLIEALANQPEFAAEIRKSIRLGARYRRKSISLTGSGSTASSGSGTLTVTGKGAARQADQTSDATGMVVTNLEQIAKIVESGPTRYPEEFYQRIAIEYRNQTPGGRPGAFLSESLGVPISTVWRWVRVCRDRGLLPKARPGKEG